MSLIRTLTAHEKASHNSHKFGFTLSPKNYSYWKTMLKLFLITNNLYGYVDGSIPRPTDKSTSVTINPDYSTWTHNNAHATMIVISTISEAYFLHVQGNTARELWTSLERAYAPHTAFREYTRKTQLLQLCMKGDETPLVYLSRVQDIANALANIGELVQDKDLVLYVISGLREEYNGLKSTILARSYPLIFSDHDYMVTIPCATATTSTSHKLIPHSNCLTSDWLPAYAICLHSTSRVLLRLLSTRRLWRRWERSMESFVETIGKIDGNKSIWEIGGLTHKSYASASFLDIFNHDTKGTHFNSNILGKEVWMIGDGGGLGRG